MTKKQLEKKMDKYANKAYKLMKAIKRDKKENPLTLEGVIRAMMLKSPSMMQYRDDALDMLYCVLGTGIGWRDGRLGDTSPNNYMNLPPDAGGQGCWSMDFGMSDSLKKIFEKYPDKELKAFEQAMLETRKKEANEIFATVDNIDERCKTYRLTKNSWYPISWYACHLCCPGGAQQDFIDGAIETIGLINKTEPPKKTKEWIDHQDTKKCANEILAALKAAQKIT